MFIIAIILAILLYKVISKPATGPFTTEIQHIWEKPIGKAVIIIVLIIIALL